MEIQPWPVTMAQKVLSELGISDPADALVALATTPLNLDLIARVHGQSPSGNLTAIVTEVGLWREFFNRIDEQESSLENPGAGRLLRAEAVALARLGLSTADRSVTLPIDSTRIQRQLIEWEILRLVNSGGRRYRFRHEQLQDYLVAEDAFAARLTAEELMSGIDAHRTVGVVDWLTKLYAQAETPDQVWFLQTYVGRDSPLPFFGQATILGAYLHRDVSGEPSEVIDAILGAVQSVPGMRKYFFAANPHPSWAEHLWQHGFYAAPPPPSVDEQGRQWLGHWDAQRYLISVAAQAPRVVMQHAMTIDGDGWYIGWALDAVCSVPPAEALPIVERIVNWFGDPVIAGSIEHAAYQLMMRFAQAGEQDAAFAIFEAMTAPRFPPPEQAADMRMGPEGLALQSDHYELFTNELAQLAQLDFGRLAATLEHSLRGLVSFNTPPSSYVARNAFWRSAIEDTDQDSNNSAAEKLLVALRNSLGARLDTGLRISRDCGRDLSAR